MIGTGIGREAEPRDLLEPAGWRAAVPLPNLAVCTAKNATSYPDDILLQKKCYFFGREFRVVVPKFSRELFCRLFVELSHTG